MWKIYGCGYEIGNLKNDTEKVITKKNSITNIYILLVDSILGTFLYFFFLFLSLSKTISIFKCLINDFYN